MTERNNYNIGISLEGLKHILNARDSQPKHWRLIRDREADAKDGNWFNSQQIAYLKSKGIAPAMDNLIRQAVRDAGSVAEENRKDAKLVAQPSAEQDTVDALSEKLFAAEEESKTDRACLKAHEAQIGVGLGWVEPQRGSDVFGPKYVSRYISRNEIWWDMHAPIHDIQSAMWMLRQKWAHKDAIIAQFPKRKEEIEAAVKYGNKGDRWHSEGGESTGLTTGQFDSYREWTTEEHNWMDRDSNMVCIQEVITKRVEMGLVLRTPDGRIIEFDKQNPGHFAAAGSGQKIEKAPLIRLDQTFFLGPVRLGARRLKSRNFPYIPFYYFTEDLTEIPYGMVKALMDLQAEHISRLSNYIWGLGSVVTIRTKGAVDMPDEIFRQVVSRRDADIVLNAEAMARPGAKFEILRDYELNQQQYQRTGDLRESIKDAAGTRDAKDGSNGQSDIEGKRQGYEMASKSISGLTAQYEESRMAVLGAILEMIIVDSQETEDVHIRAKLLRKTRVVTINQENPEGKTNDVQLIQAQVGLEDVPSSPDRNRQEMVSLSELGKSLPEKYQVALAPYIVSLSGGQFSQDLAEKFLNLEQQVTPEQIDQQIKEAVEAALIEERTKLKARELDIKELTATALVDDTEAATALKRVEAALKRVETIYSGTQAAMGVAQVPEIAPITQEIVDSAGFEDQNKAPVFSQPGLLDKIPVGSIDSAIPEANQNTSPMFPPNPQPPNRAGPTTPNAILQAEQSDVGALSGIEKQGNQQEIE